MRPGDVQEMLRKRPFEPFLIRLSNGQVYEVRHPELVAVGRSTIFTGQPAADIPEPIYDRFALVDLLHIAEIKPLAPAAPAGGT